MTKVKLETKEQIFEFLTSLEPKGTEYKLVKEFIADDIFDVLDSYGRKKLNLPPEMRDIPSYIRDRWNEFIKNPEDKDYEVERQLLEYGRRIVEAEKLFNEGDVPSCVQRLDGLDADAEKDKLEDYVLGHTKQIRDKINNREYITIENGELSINENFILHDIESKLAGRNMPRHQISELAKKVYANMEVFIKRVAKATGTDSEKIKMINKNIYENIDKIPQELLNYYSLSIYFKEYCNSDIPFTDEEARDLIEKFNKLKEFFKKVEEKLADTERSEGEKVIKSIEGRFYRPFAFFSVIERNGAVYAAISGPIARTEFLDYVKRKILERGYDEECANIAVENILRGKISCPLPWKNVEAMVGDMVEKAIAIADVEATKKCAGLLAERSQACSGINEGILLAKEMECLLVKMQNRIYVSLVEEFRSLYASYLTLVSKTMERIDKSNLPPEQKYSIIKELGGHLHNFDNGEYENVRKRLEDLTAVFAKDMLYSVGQTKVIKHKIKFWSGVAAEVAGLAAFGFGLVFLPQIAPFGVAVLPVGMKLIKDGVSELKDKHKEFVGKNKPRPSKQEKNTGVV